MRAGDARGARGVHVIPADAGTQRKTKHATTSLASRTGSLRNHRHSGESRNPEGRCKGKAPANWPRIHHRRGYANHPKGARASKPMRAADARGARGVNVIPADAGTQRKTKHATTPFVTRRERERANRCERGMPGAAGGKRHSRGRALCPTSVIPADAEIQRGRATEML